MEEPELIVVGGGVAGAAAALRAAQYHLSAVWILGDRDTEKASRGAYVTNIDNMIGVHPDIIRQQIVDLLSKEHPEAAATVEKAHLHISTREIIRNARERVEAEFAEQVRLVPHRAADAHRDADGLFQVATADGGTHRAPAVVLATGVMDRQPVIHKQKGDRTLAGIHWLFPYANHETLLYCIRCEGHLVRDSRVAVVGAGPGAAEVSLMIRERYGTRVTLLTAGEEVTWGDARATDLARQGVRIVHGNLVDIHGAERGSRLCGFTVEGGERIDLDLSFVVMGLHRVYNDLARALGAELHEAGDPPERSHVLIGPDGETSVPGLYAIGDMSRERQRPVMKQIYTAQEYAVRAVDVIDRRRRLAGRAGKG